ncbi:MAG TPA: toll/interleukin-1 receptor domain-containing protein [Archangium sp.]|nr:toll/interleukin-1 receptor domain-containing protein [Archangium sp.]
MSYSVFISYARHVNREQAVALHQALGGNEGQAFLDTEGIEPGARFPPELADALLGARVIVIFASEAYFQRWYCLWELEVALEPFRALGPEATESERSAALALIVVALSGSQASSELLPLPPELRTTNWPAAEDTGELARRVRERLESNPEALEERLAASGSIGVGLRTRLVEGMALPPPKNLAGARKYPRMLFQSLGESFVGRADDLWRIHYTLSVLHDRRGVGASGAALTGALEGMGGAGKTRLAVEYLHRFGPSHYPGGLFWVDAEVQPERLEEQFHGILRALKPEVPDLVEFRKAERSAAQEMAEALDAIAARERVLYVVDNVPEPVQDEAPKSLWTWCPVIGRVSLLATSRTSLGLEGGVHALPISTLAPDAAVTLLTRGLGRSRVDEAGWYRIAEWVGYLPLALDLLNRAMLARGISPEELLARAQEQEPLQELERQMKLLRRHVPAKSLRGITEAFSISYERLLEPERQAARLIAQLASEPIPLALLEALGPEVSATEVRSTLELRHFVTPVEDGAVRMFGGMHRVLADYLRGCSPEPLKELHQIFEALRTLMPADACRDPKAWPLLSACLPHALNVFERLMQSDATSDLEKGGLLGLALGTFLLARGLAEPAWRISQRTVERVSGVLGHEPWLLLTVMGNLAQALHDMGELRSAQELVEELVMGRVRLYGEEHPSTLTEMNNLAAILMEQGKLIEARRIQERVLEVRKRSQGEEHQDTLISACNLASTLRLLGELPSARALGEQVLSAMRRLLGEEHPLTLTAMNSLAVIRSAQGDLAGAQVLEEQALAVRLRTQGEAHPNTLVAMSNLGATLRAQGDLSGARKLAEQVLEGTRRRLGDEHPSTLVMMNNLAGIIREQGDLLQARTLEEQVLETRRRVQGEAHPDTLTATNNLCRTYFAMGQLARARELEEQVLEVRRRVQGETHLDTVTTMNNLVGTLLALGEFADAQALGERVLELRRQVLGEGHPDTIMSMWNLAGVLRARGDVAAAESLEEEAQKHLHEPLK